MTSKLFIPVIILISLLSLINKKKEIDENIPLHIVELYTSQGCSSCPSADKVLSELSDRNDVLTLAFHVSYWDRLGWKDPFSSKIYDYRQRSYVQKFGLNGAYTPQAIVDGEKEIIGSKKDGIEKLLSKSIVSTVNISFNQKMVDDKLYLNYSLTGKYQDKKLFYGIIENNLKTKVKKGENGGKNLVNDGVVRYFNNELLGVNPIGEVELNLSNLDINKNNVEIFVFVQDPEDFHIFGATKQKLSTAQSSN